LARQKQQLVQRNHTKHFKKSRFLVDIAGARVILETRVVKNDSFSSDPASLKDHLRRSRVNQTLIDN